MKVFATMWMVLACAIAVFAAAPKGMNLDKKSALTDPRIEIAELEQLIAATKESGFPVDPAWTERLLELRPLAKNHAGNARFDLPNGDLTGGFAPGALIRATELTPLEAQIQEVEMQLMVGLGQEVDDVTFMTIKTQLNELYAQRPINRERNPLDQGADVCPGTVVTGVPYTDSGTTVGRGNNYAEDSSATCPNYSGAPEVVYAFTPSSTQTYTINTEGSSYDTYLYINTGGACPGNTHVACDDDNGSGVNSFISVLLIAGQTYYIFVDGFNTASGAYVLNIFGNCAIECQPTDIIECAGEYQGPGNEVTDCNGGCDNVISGGTESWQEIQPCQTICGRGFTYLSQSGNNRRDVDGYRLTLTEACSLDVTVNAEFASQIYVTAGSCPWNILYISPAWSYACSTITFRTPCFQPGTYSVLILPGVFTGINEPSQYRARVDLVPCSGCKIDAAFTAPATVAWNTCGAGNDNSLRPSTDYTYCVNIPHDGDWTFSTCNDDSIWDSYLYLSTQCNGGIIAQDDDGCGGVGLSVINCVPLIAGTYYLTVEGWSSTRCGPFVLNVSECLGSCCYGDPADPVCAYISPSACDSLSGIWTSQEPCSSGACFTRPECSGNAVEFSQAPIVPDENLSAPFSDAESPYRAYDDFSLATTEIGAVRFWGFWADLCLESPASFELLFVDSVSNTTQTYNLSLTETATGLTYLGIYPLYQYDAVLFPPCEITSGWLSVYGNNPAGCYFAWCNSPFGNGLSVQTTNGVPSSTFSDLAFCLSEAPCEVDSLTYLWDSPGNATLRWYQSQTGVVTVWYTTDPNAVYPAGYTPVSFAAAAGNNSLGTNANFADNIRVVLTLDCTPAAAANASAPPAVLDLRDAQE